MKNNGVPGSRFSQHVQWVVPTKKKNKKDYFAYHATRGWKGKAYNCKPLHNPPLCAHDEAIFFLHIAAEVEHALMVQYLYAAFSLGGSQIPPEKKELVSTWRRTILDIAREEMGHLITVQNILHSVGGPLTFVREDFPFDSRLYPFSFSLEPLTLNSLAKYVVAEMPSEDFLIKHKQKKLIQEIQPIKRLAMKGNKGKNINRVGMIYENVQNLLNSVDPSDFLSDSENYQSSHSAWGTNDNRIIIKTATNLKEAKDALGEIAEQGEGEEVPFGKTQHPSHFERFMEIYRELRVEKKLQPSKNLPINPSTNVSEEKPGPSDITNEKSLLWAQLSNQRYRMILLYLSHSLQMEIQPESHYGQIISWTFGEMYNLRSISDILTTLPQKKGPNKGRFAASPFEQPYNLNMPAREINKWRTHRDQILNSQIIINELLEYKDPRHENYLKALKSADEQTLAIINSILKP